VVNLRDAKGNIIQTTQTMADGTGLYTFSNPPTGHTFVNVAVGRNQVASPMSYKTTINSPTYYDFSLRNFPATIQVKDVQSTFVLISTYPYAGATPPTVNVGSPSPTMAWSKTIGSDGTVNLLVPQGTYYITCWKQVNCRGTLAYLSTGNSLVNNGNAVVPQVSYPTSCSATPACP
jgi:hypothetical protein